MAFWYLRNPVIASWPPNNPVIAMNDSTLECKQPLGVDYLNLEKKLTLLQDKSDALLRNHITALGSDTYGWQLTVCNALRDEDISLAEFEVILKSSDDEFARP
jgi:hypothetical protein